MEGLEMLAYEFGKMREAEFLRDAERWRLADIVHNTKPIGNRLPWAVPLVLSLSAAVAWLMVR